MQVAVFVRHGLGVEKSLVLDDFTVFTREPHLHQAVRRSHLHADQAGDAHSHFHLRDADGGAVEPVPRPEKLRIGLHLPDEINRCIEVAFDHHHVPGSSEVTHPFRFPAVTVGVV
jgi:hypothetical protein